MQTTGRLDRRRSLWKAGVATAASALGLGMLLSIGIAPTGADPKPYDNQSFTAEGAHSYEAEERFHPQCPEAIVDTPGSFPATKELTGSNTFEAGSDVHFVYHDNPDFVNEDFVIQDCLAVYPADFFDGATFDEGGVLTDDSYSKNDLSDGTPVDAVAMTGIVPESGDITYKWTVPEDVEGGSWICNFARDVANAHAGEGNRKALPVCFQVPDDPGPNPLTPDVDYTEKTACGQEDTIVIHPVEGVSYFDDEDNPVSGTITLEEGEGPITIHAELDDPENTAFPEDAQTEFGPFTGSEVQACAHRPDPDPDPTTTTTTTEAPTTTTTEAPTTTTSELPELPFTPEPEIVTTTTVAPLPELAFTGSDTASLAAIALVMISMGGVLYAGSRRRRQA
jgi:hypothetical protein